MRLAPLTGRRAAARWALAGALVLAVLASTGCTSTRVRWHEVGTGPSGGPGPTLGPVASALAIAPGANAKNVSPAAPVTATMTGGTLSAVTLTNATGQPVTGSFDAARGSWRNSQPLGYGKTYRLTVTGSGADGKAYQDSRTFTTVRPRNLTLPYLRANEGTLLDGGTFGVGQPIVVWFDEPIKNKAAAERALTVTTDASTVVGGWYWMDSHEVHWRPRDYWPAGAKVTVTAAVYGHDLGGGLYGQADRSASFTIGRSKVAIADSKTHRMKVYLDGKLVTRINGKDVTAGIPISMGKGGSERTAHGVVDFTTNSGPHVVTLKYEVYHMTSSSFGITNPSSPNFYAVDIRKSIRITGDGEFVHLRDWAVWQIGKMNTSHGCINVGVDYIYWFYNMFGAGDIVDVTGTARHLDLRNGLGDWVLSWADWQKGSALS